MSDVRDPATDQQLPVEGEGAIHEYVIGMLAQWVPAERLHYTIDLGLRARLALGIKKYGRPLQYGNGRDALQDAWEEALDALVYSVQLYLEADARDESPEEAVVSVAMELVSMLASLKLNRGDAEVLLGGQAWNRRRQPWPRRWHCSSVRSCSSGASWNRSSLPLSA